MAVFERRKMALTSQNQREDIFAPSHYCRDRTASNNSPPPGPKGQTCPGVARSGMETGQTEPCINSLLANPVSEQELSLKSRNTSLIEFHHIFIFCLSEVNNETIIPRVVRLCIARAVTKGCAPGISLGYYEHVPWLLSQETNGKIIFNSPPTN